MVTGPKGKGNRPWAKGPWWSPVTIVQAISFSWVNGIINAAEAQAELTEEQARSILPDRDDAPTVAANFEAAYARKKQAYPGLLPSAWFNTTTRALISLYHLDLLKHAFWVCTEVAVRLLSPVALRQFLIYLQQYNARNPLATEYSWHGWLLALALGAGGLCMCIIHHQLFWVGMRVGFLMRQQCIAAVHSKVLRLNASAVSHISQGHVVNLVSNDVRRFDDAIPFWVFLWAGPLELGMVLLMVSLELGILPALAGISATLILIPVQAILVRPVAGIRTATAQRTDERVRLASEVIQGALAMKMLSWEAPFSAALADIRAKEASHVRQMARIRATNMALQFAIMPIVSFATFAVYRALNGSLNVASVFYALSLLSLPKLYMVQFFILGIQSCTELKVSLRRIDAFLSSEEPPLPVVNTDGQSMSSATADAAANAGLSSLNSDVHSSIALQAAKQAPVASVRSAEACHSLPRGWVELRGADFDWAQPLGHAGGNGGLSDVGTSGKAAGHALYEQRSPGGKATEHGTVEQQGSIAAGLKTGDWQTAAKGGNFSADQEAVEQTEESIGTGSSVAGATLQGLRLQLQAGELLAVCGEVGSGKSSLLSALLGELQPLPPLPGSPSLPNPPTGFPHVRVDLGPVGIPLGPLMLGRVAYCAQIPWIVAGTIRDNIVFGSEWDAARYARVLTACALTTDIASLPAGDGTELGERGVNLSGGQKARVALARAAYCQADICLLDDPLSAVDPRVGRVLFGECVRGVMNGRTRVLITHQRQYLGLCDRVLVLRGGRPVAGPAPYKELQGRDDLPELTAGATGAMAEVTVDELVDTVDPVEPWHPVDEDRQAAKQTIPGSPSESAPLSHLRVVDLSEISLATVQLPVAREASRMRRVLSRMFAPGPGFLNEGEAPVGRRPTCTPRMAMFSRPPLGVEKQEVARAGVLNAKSTDGGKLVVQEERQMGVVPWSVYFRYMNNVGPILSGMLGLFLVGGQGVYLASEWWLMLWSQADAEDQSSLSWLLVYGILVAVVFVVSLTRAFMFFEATVSAATRVHNAMAQRVLQAPLSFFHTNPAGRILNRFSKDLGLVDDLLPTTLFDALQVGFLVLSAIVLVAVAVPFILPVFLPMAYVFYVVRRRYLIASREVKRCEATSRSPVFAFFSSTLKGLTTIRAFAAMPRFHEAFLGELSTNGSWWYAFLATSRWIGFRLDLLSAATLLFTALLAMATRDTVSPALLALALTHTLQLTGFMQWFVRQTAEVENNMTSMERMLAYTDLPQEPATVAQGAPAPPEGWPSSGALTYEQVTAVYRPGLPPVLTDISFTLRAGSSCGVVGRTGSGKSSLMLTLFRLIDITSGRIMLDGLDTSCIGLDALRKQLAIIPQDPVLFSGTVRSNLDPWGVHGDMALWDAIGAAALKPAITAAGGLGARMAEAGDNLSVGQRQLFCLARALLQQAKVLALDEATANVDRATDALIQGALREFAHAGGDGRVLLVIAHRLDTVADTDHLLVLDKGVLIESGSPAQLAAQPGGLFASMVKATGHVHLPTS